MRSALARAVDRQELARWRPPAGAFVEARPAAGMRCLGATVMAFFAALLAWACLGRLDTVAVASGQVLPSGRTRAVQVLEAAPVRRVPARDGAHVAAGEVLLELDHEPTSAVVQRLRGELRSARLALARARALARAPEAPAEAFVSRFVTGPMRLAALGLLRARAGEFVALRDRFEAMARERRASFAVLRARIARVDALEPLLEERVSGLSKLAALRAVARTDYLRLAAELVSLRHERMIDRARLAEREANLRSLARERDRAVAAFRRDLAETEVRASARVAELEERLREAKSRDAARTLRAPVAGFVHHVRVTGPGAVVEAGQRVMEIVPDGEALEVEARLPDREVGFVHAGQRATVKLRAFPFTRYGSLEGRVLRVSPTAMRGRGGALAYSVRVAVPEQAMVVEGERIALRPGMGATVEVHTGRRRLISYFLSPILEHGQEAMREP